jgi:hypothetical protein
MDSGRAAGNRRAPSFLAAGRGKKGLTTGQTVYRFPAMLKQRTVFRFLCMLALVTLSAGLLAACGGDDESTTQSTQSKKAFIQAADVICTRENGSIRAQALEYQEKHGVSDDPKKQEELIESIIIPAMQNQADGIAELDPPAQDGKEAEAFVAQLEDVIAATEDDPTLVLQQTGPYQDLREAGEAFGFKACGR